MIFVEFESDIVLTVGVREVQCVVECVTVCG